MRARTALRNAIVGVLAVVAVALLVGAFVLTRTEASAARAEAASYTPPPLTTPSPAPLPVVAVIGDDTSVRAASGVDAAERWPALVEAAQPVDVQTFASPEASWTSGGAGGRSFEQQASRIPTDSALVVLFGGARDADTSALRLSRAVSQTISAVQYRAPDAVIVVVGPVTTDGADTETLTTLRTGLQNDAGAFDVRFVDPVQQAWLNDDPSTASGLTADDQVALAQHFETLITQLIPNALG